MARLCRRPSRAAPTAASRARLSPRFFRPNEDRVYAQAYLVIGSHDGWPRARFIRSVWFPYLPESFERLASGATPSDLTDPDSEVCYVSHEAQPIEGLSHNPTRPRFKESSNRTGLELDSVRPLKSPVSPSAPTRNVEFGSAPCHSGALLGWWRRWCKIA